jgi:Velvet factor
MMPLAGTTTSDIYRIANIVTGEPQYIFLFPDLSVRQEGHYKLRCSLFQRLGEDIIFRTSIVSNTLRVYAAKEFPGMAETTPLTLHLKNYGLRVKCSKSIRGKIKVIAEVFSVETLLTKRQKQRERLGQGGDMVDSDIYQC